MMKIVEEQGRVYQGTWMSITISVKDKVAARDVLGTAKIQGGVTYRDVHLFFPETADFV